MVEYFFVQNRNITFKFKAPVRLVMIEMSVLTVQQTLHVAFTLSVQIQLEVTVVLVHLG